MNINGSPCTHLVDLLNSPRGLRHAPVGSRLPQCDLPLRDRLPALQARPVSLHRHAELAARALGRGARAGEDPAASRTLTRLRAAERRRARRMAVAVLPDALLHEGP